MPNGVQYALSDEPVKVFNVTIKSKHERKDFQCDQAKLRDDPATYDEENKGRSIAQCILSQSQGWIRSGPVIRAFG